MPPKAEVFIADQSQKWQANYALWLPRGKHHIVGAATSVEQADALICGLRQSGAVIDVFIVDKSVGRRARSRHGLSVVKTAQREYPGARIIATTNGVDGVDGMNSYLEKADIEPSMLVNLINAA